MRKNKVAVLFFRAGLYAFPFSKYKTSTLSKFTEPWKNANIVFNVSDGFAYIFYLFYFILFKIYLSRVTYSGRSLFLHRSLHINIHTYKDVKIDNTHQISISVKCVRKN